MAGRVEGGDPDVVGHEDPAGTDRGGAGGRVGAGRAEVRHQARGQLEGVTADVRQGPGPTAGKGPVEKARHVELVGEPPRKVVAQGDGGGEIGRRPAVRRVGDEGDDVEHAEARVDAVVGAQVEMLERGAGEGAGGGNEVVGRCDEGVHRPVVVRIAMEVEEGGSGAGGQRGEDGIVPTLADVDDALEDLFRCCHDDSVPASGACCSEADGETGPLGPLPGPGGVAT